MVWGTLLLAVFAWGLGFYGPPVYLHAVREARGWPVALVSAAVTLHFLVGAMVVAFLPALHRRHGLPRVTRWGAASIALGVVGWAAAREPWQLFLAAIPTGAGWATMGSAALNAIISPWFVTGRPRALAMAYNGASIGGVIFSPLWTFAIAAFGFETTAIVIGAVSFAVVTGLTLGVLGRTPGDLGQQPDGGARPPEAAPTAPSSASIAGAALWRDRAFQSLAAGSAIGLFAQAGIIAHLLSLIVPALGTTGAGIAMGAATAAAIFGRTALAWWLPPWADRRVVVSASYAVQVLGLALLAATNLASPVAVVVGTLLFGFGIGNATSMPPLIAQAEFAPADTGRVFALVVAMGQGAYAFAPLLFGLLRAVSGAAEGTVVCGVAIALKLVAILVYLGWRRR